jgi:hypothetical protein
MQLMLRLSLEERCLDSVQWRAFTNDVQLDGLAMMGGGYSETSVIPNTEGLSVEGDQQQLHSGVKNKLVFATGRRRFAARPGIRDRAPRVTA